MTTGHPDGDRRAASQMNPAEIGQQPAQMSASGQASAPGSAATGGSSPHGAATSGGANGGAHPESGGGGPEGGSGSDLPGQAKAALGKAGEKAQDLLGQVASRAPGSTGDTLNQTAERVQQPAGQAPEQIRRQTQGFMEQLESLSVDNYSYAVFGALGASALLLLMGRRSLASFIGLWSAIILNLGLYRRLAKGRSDHAMRG